MGGYGGGGYGGGGYGAGGSSGPATIADLATQVFQRLEEVPSAPVFWNDYEAYCAIAEAMNEAALITGVVQTVLSPFTLPVNTNYVDLPEGSMAILRMTGPQPIQKTEIFSLDQMIPGWETTGGAGANPPVQTIQYWFPVGLTQFGIYPQLTVSQQVVLTTLTYPVTGSRPYDGTQTVPFQIEFQDALQQYAAHIMRLKETGNDFDESQLVYQQFLDTMRSLTAFQARHDSLVFARTMGAPVRVVPVEVR